MTTKLTIVLINWKRRQNVGRIITGLTEQSIRPRIFVWNNHPEPFVDPRPDWVVDSSNNLHGHPLPFLWSQADTEFVAFQDDDLVAADDSLYADAVEVLRRQPEPDRLLGAFGVNLVPGKTYQTSAHIHLPATDTPVDLVKNRLVLLRREAAARLPHRYPNHHVDLWASTILAGNRRRHHLLAGCFHKRITELPQGKVGYSQRKDHHRLRNEVSAGWLARIATESSVR